MPLLQHFFLVATGVLCYHVSLNDSMGERL